MHSNPVQVGDKLIYSPDSDFWLHFWCFSGWFPRWDVIRQNPPLCPATVGTGLIVSVEKPRIKCPMAPGCFLLQAAGKGKLSCVWLCHACSTNEQDFSLQSCRSSPLHQCEIHLIKRRGGNKEERRKRKMFNCSWHIGTLCYELYTQSQITASKLMPASHLSSYKQ